MQECAFEKENKLMIEPRSQSEVALMCVRFMSVVFMHLNAHNIDYYYYYYFQYALSERRSH